VSSASAANGIGGSNVMNYTYAGLKIHLLGGGLLGFRKFDTTDAQTGIKTSNVFRQDYPYQGLVMQVSQTQSSGAILSQVDNNWADNPALNSISYPNPPTTGRYHRSDLFQTIATGNDLNGAPFPTVTTTTTYDGYGNAKGITVSTGDGYSKTTSNDYLDPDTVNWILGRLKRSTVTSVTP